MRLDSTLAEQIEALIVWMEDTAAKEPPSAVQHQERSLELKERAWFLKEICLPKIPTQKIALATVDGANGNLPERPDNLLRSGGFLRGKGPNTEALMGEAQELTEPVT